MHDERSAAQRIVAKRWRIAALLTTVMIVGYFGFILLVAYGKSLAGTLIFGGRVSVGIVLGAGVILLAPIITAIYVRWANRHYDPAVASVRDEKREP
jgi:uncharacterized membrane protein (DUF485 family)